MRSRDCADHSISRKCLDLTASCRALRCSRKGCTLSVVEPAMPSTRTLPPTRDDKSLPVSPKAPQPPAGSTLTGGAGSEAGTLRSRRRARRVKSSWIRTLSYVPVEPAFDAAVPDDADGFLLIETRSDNHYAYVVPSWVCGLLVAAQAQGRSVGSAFNRLVKQRHYSSVKLT